MKWKDLIKEEKKERINNTYESVNDNDESVNLFEKFRMINPDIEITQTELYEYLVR